MLRRRFLWGCVFSSILWHAHKTEQALMCFFSSESRVKRGAERFPEFIKHRYQLSFDSCCSINFPSLCLFFLTWTDAVKLPWPRFMLVFNPQETRAMLKEASLFLHLSLPLSLSWFFFRLNSSISTEHLKVGISLCLRTCVNTEGLTSSNGRPLYPSSSALQKLSGVVTMATFGASLLFGRVCSDCLLSRLIWCTARKTISGLQKVWMQ